MGYIVSTDLKIVKGYLRSAIYDLTREDYDYIPNDLADTLLNGLSLEKMSDAQFNWLIEKEFLLEINDKDRANFEIMKLDWDYPAKILNLSLSSEILVLHFDFILQMVIDFNIPSVAIIDINGIENTLNLMAELEKTPVLVVEWLTKYDKNQNYAAYVEEFRKLKSIVIYEAPNNKEKFGNDGFGNIVHKINSFFIDSPQLQHPSFFNVNTELFTESIHFHTYFNRRVHINAVGEIFQSHHSKKSFGNIESISKIDEMSTIIQSRKFRAIGNVTKDQTDICKNCEHRYMCVDSREPLKRGLNEWYHGSECNYNPFIALWSNEAKFLSLSKIGIQSNDKEFKIDDHKVAEVVKSIWNLAL